MRGTKPAGANVPARSQRPQEVILARLQSPGPGVCPLPASPHGLCAPRSCPACTPMPVDSPTNGLGSPSPYARANQEPWELRSLPPHGMKRLKPSLSRQKLFLPLHPAPPLPHPRAQALLPVTQARSLEAVLGSSSLPLTSPRLNSSTSQLPTTTTTLPLPAPSSA